MTVKGLINTVLAANSQTDEISLLAYILTIYYYISYFRFTVPWMLLPALLLQLLPWLPLVQCRECRRAVHSPMVSTKTPYRALVPGTELPQEVRIRYSPEARHMRHTRHMRQGSRQAELQGRGETGRQ